MWFRLPHLQVSHEVTSSVVRIRHRLDSAKLGRRHNKLAFSRDLGSEFLMWPSHVTSDGTTYSLRYQGSVRIGLSRAREAHVTDRPIPSQDEV